MFSNFSDKYIALLNEMPITPFDREYIQTRYIKLVDRAALKHIIFAAIYTIFTNYITVAGIVVALLSSIQKKEGLSDTAQEVLYWATIIVGVLITIANKVLYANEVPKQYMLTEIYHAKLVSDGYMFIRGIGPYASEVMADRVNLFALRIEQLKMKTVNIQDSDGDKLAQDLLGFGGEHGEILSPRIHPAAKPNKIDKLDKSDKSINIRDVI